MNTEHTPTEQEEWLPEPLDQQAPEEPSWATEWEWV